MINKKVIIMARLDPVLKLMARIIMNTVQIHVCYVYPLLVGGSLSLSHDRPGELLCVNTWHRQCFFRGF
jgi:hypothetical protein